MQLISSQVYSSISFDSCTLPGTQDRQLTMGTTSELEPPGGLILEAVDFGASLMLSITEFLTYRKVPGNSLLGLYATISITTDLLRELGTTINEYESKFPGKCDLVKPVVKTCKENFERLLVVVSEGTVKGIGKSNMLGVRFMDACSLAMFHSVWNTLIPTLCLRGTLTSILGEIGRNDGTLGGATVTAKVDPWFLFGVGLGGREEAEKLWSSLDVARDTLFMLKDTLKFTFLKNLNQQ